MTENSKREERAIKENVRVIFPAQCECGHLFLERYEFPYITDDGYKGFCWCGFCRTKVMVKPSTAGEKKGESG